MLFSASFGLKGIKPEDYKFLTSSKKIESAYIPNIAYIPVVEKVGSSPKIIVKEGQVVDEGQVIAIGNGINSSNVHSSIPGIVKGFTKKTIFDGSICKSVIIELEGEFKKTGKDQSYSDWSSLNKTALLKNIFDNGVVGFGASGISTSNKLLIPDDKTINTLIINAVECEPFLTCDHRILLDKTEDFFEGIKIVNKILDNPQVVIGVGANKKDAIHKLKTFCHPNFPYKIISFKTKYPQGEEKLLVKAYTKRNNIFYTDPIDLGVLVLNVSTILAIKEAIVNDKPLIDRIITVSGTGIVQPKNLKVKIGTLISDIIDECGGLKSGVKKIIIGGPMMGFSVKDLDIPITKECSSILALTEEEIKDIKTTVCINCGKCINACSFGLMPAKLNKFIKNNLYEKALEYNLQNCTQCGACSWICPAKIPLSEIFKSGIAKITEQNK